jgi:DNA-binding transcriptional LysR family regulator
MDRFSEMETFIRVFETGSFSGAARQLRIGQPAVSKAINLLEKRLGVHLILRSSHGLTPTEAGRSFYEKAKRAIDEADEADAAARGEAAALTGRLRICTAITFGRLHVIPRLAAFLAQHPALEIDVVMEDRSIDLVEGGIDVALRMGVLADSSLRARHIAQCRRLVLGTPGYFEKAGEPVIPADLARHQAMVLAQPGLGSVWKFRKGTEDESVTVAGRVRFSAGEGVREAVIAGLGLTVGSEWLFAPELAHGIVKPVMLDWTLPPLDLWAVFPTGRSESAKTRAFVAFVQSILPASGNPGP